MLTTVGVVAAGAMVTSYALESRHRRWVAVFAVACAVTALYAVATGAWLFAILEFVWAAVATKRFMSSRAKTVPGEQATLIGQR